MNPTRPVRDAVAATIVGRRLDLARLAAWALLGALPTFLSGLAVAGAVDDGFLAGRTGTGLAWLGLLAATVPLGAVGARRTYLGVGRMVEPLRDQLVRVVVDGALRRSTTPGGVAEDTGAVARLTQHVETVRDTVAGLLLVVLGFVAALVAALIGLLALAPMVLPLVVVPLVGSLGVFVATLPLVTSRQRRVLLADEELAHAASSIASGLRDIVACGGEERVTDLLDERIDEQVAAGRAMARATGLRTLVVAVGAQLPVVLVLLAAGPLLHRGLTPGALLGTLTYLVQGLEPAVVSVVSSVGAPLAQLGETIRRLDEAVPPAAPVPAPIGRIAPGRDDLAARGVTFRYRTAAEPVLSGLDLDLPAGDHLAVVGPSGAGKSTLAALLVGVLRPQSGRVWHGDQDAWAVAPQHRVLIPQQAYVFRGSLGENLRYLHPAATPTQLDRAVAAVGLADLVDRLGGYRAELDPGRLSAGERQLIALGRAFLSTARVVVLDEATCHLDPEAEAVAEEAFAARGGTLVVIAHRLSSAQRARRVLLLDGPRSLEGAHEDLSIRSPLYADLVGHWDGVAVGNEKLL